MEVQRNMYTQDECLIERAHAIRSEHEDARIIFEVAQEACNYCIVFEVVQAVLLEEDIGVINEDDDLPGGGQIYKGQ